MPHSHSPWQRCIPELLSMIYMEGDPLAWPRGITFAPLRVCSSWRQTALTTPQIWSVIHYHAYKGDKMRESLTWWLSLTSGRSVPLDFHISTSFNSPSVEGLEWIVAMLINRVCDWRALTLYERDNRSLRGLLDPNLLLKANKLEVLHLEDFPEFVNEASELDGVTVNFPNLIEFYLSGSSLRSLPTILAPKLVTLDLLECSMSEKEFSDLTTNMPTLRHLTISDVPYRTRSLPSKDIQYFLPSLKSLEFDTCPKIPQVFFEALCLHAPQLEELYLIGSKIRLDNALSKSQFAFRTFLNRSDDNFSHFDRWAYIVSRSPYLHTLDTSFASQSEFPDDLPKSLIDLTLRLERSLSQEMDTIYNDDVVDLLWEATKLERLTLEWDQEPLNGEDSVFIMPFLVALSPTDDDFMLCPKLHHLELIDTDAGQFEASHVLEISRSRTKRLEHNLQRTEDGEDLMRSKEFLISLIYCGGLPDVQNANYAALQMHLDLYAMGSLRE